MMTSYEIAAVFRLTDEFTGPLRRIAAEVANLNKAIKGIADAAKATNTSVEESLRFMGGNVNKTIAEVDRLAAAWTNVSKAATVATSAGGPGRSSRNLLAAHGRSDAKLGAAAIAGYSILEALDVSDIVSKGLANVYPEGIPSNFNAEKDELTKLILQEAKITRLPLGTVAKMALDEIKTNANQPWVARMRMLPLVVESAAREAYVKGTSPEIATSAFVGQLHQIRAFTPEEIEKYGPMLAFFASKDPNALVNIGKSGAYHTPLLTSMMQIPIEQDLAAQTVLDRTGVGGKSGTWLREMAVRAAAKPRIGDKHYAEKMQTLRDFGLVDDQGRTTWMTDGHYDEQKLLHILADKLLRYAG